MRETGALIGAGRFASQPQDGFRERQRTGGPCEVQDQVEDKTTNMHLFRPWMSSHDQDASDQEGGPERMQHQDGVSRDADYRLAILWHGSPSHRRSKYTRCTASSSVRVPISAMIDRCL
jgi:hypothetical protein